MFSIVIDVFVAIIDFVAFWVKLALGWIKKQRGSAKRFL